MELRSSDIRSRPVPSAAGAEDQALLDRVAARDPAALGALYDRYGRVVFGVVYRLLGAPEPAEEVTQDAFHAVWRSAASYRPDRGSARTWILAIARNAAIDWRRTKGRRAERDADLAEAVELAGSARVDEDVISGLRAEAVRAAVAGLPDEQRTVLTLAFWSGLSQSEIASRTGTPLGTVKSRARLGLARLRDQLGPEDDG